MGKIRLWCYVIVSQIFESYRVFISAAAVNGKWPKIRTDGGLGRGKLAVLSRF